MFSNPCQRLRKHSLASVFVRNFQLRSIQQKKMSQMQPWRAQHGESPRGRSAIQHNSFRPKLKFRFCWGTKILRRRTSGEARCRTLSRSSLCACRASGRKSGKETILERYKSQDSGGKDTSFLSGSSGRKETRQLLPRAGPGRNSWESLLKFCSE